MSEMRVLLNAASCRTGGAIQVASSFLSFLAELPDWHGKVLLSRPVSAAMAAEPRAGNFEYEVLDPAPGQALRGRRTRKRILEVSEGAYWDVAFSIFGPAYVAFGCPHLVGFADGWASHATATAYLRHTRAQRLMSRVKSWYKLHELRSATEIVTETETARQGLLRGLQWAPGRVHVIPNAGANSLSRFLSSHRPRPAFSDPGPANILCIAAAYPHKNTILVAEVAHRLREVAPAFGFRFIMTLSTESREWRLLQERSRRLGVLEMVENRGPVPVNELGLLYNECDLVLQPSLLETFSATYVEAFEMQRPLLASRLGFAEDVCGQGAIYFDPTSAEECAQAIQRVAQDPALRAGLIAEGTRRLEAIGDARTKFGRQVRLLESFCARHRKPS